MVHHCWGAVMRLLKRGIMCRGYITRGLVYHDGSRFIGSGYEQAYSKEEQVTAFKRNADEKGTPFVEVDSIVCDFVRDCDDQCVKKMFTRFVKTDGTVTALFPFQSLQHSFIIAGFGHTFDPGDEMIKPTNASNDRNFQRTHLSVRRPNKSPCREQGRALHCSVGRATRGMQ